MEAIRTFHTKGKVHRYIRRAGPSLAFCTPHTAQRAGGRVSDGNGLLRWRRSIGCRGLCVITVRGSNIPGGRYPCCVSTFRLRLQRTHCIFNCGLSNQLVLSNEVPPLPLSPSPPLPFPSPSSLPRLLPGLDTLGNP